MTNYWLRERDFDLYFGVWWTCSYSIELSVLDSLVTYIGQYTTITPCISHREDARSLAATIS